MAKGWITLHRQIQDHWLWNDGEPFDRRSAWIDLLLLANHDDSKFMYKDKLIDAKPGTVYRSMAWLADRWGWSRGKVRRYMDLLKKDGMIALNATKHGTTISIENYSKFQIQRPTDGPSDGHQADITRTYTTMYNNSNNSNNKGGGAGHKETYEEFLARRNAMDEAWARGEYDET